MTPEQELRATLKRMRGINGTMDSPSRSAVMRSLLDQINRAHSYGQQPEPTTLVRLAAHALVWAEEVDR